MGCNAWNHRSSCNCGFGQGTNDWGWLRGGNTTGTGSYTGATLDTNTLTKFVKSYENKKISFNDLESSRSKNSRESKTSPTKCWWCGEEVYYHTNGYGDCVLFDELGYPWQIHRCWQAYWDSQKQSSKQVNTTQDSLKINKLIYSSCLNSEDYSVLYSIKKDIAKIFIKRGADKIELEDYQGALEDFYKALTFDSTYDEDLINNIGFVKVQLEEYQSAIVDFYKIISNNPTNYKAYNNLGVAKNLLKNYESALSAFNKALFHNLCSATVYSNRAVTKNNLKDYEGAKEDYNNALVIRLSYTSIDSSISQKLMRLKPCKPRIIADHYPDNKH